MRRNMKELFDEDESFRVGVIETPGALQIGQPTEKPPAEKLSYQRSLRNLTPNSPFPVQVELSSDLEKGRILGLKPQLFI